MKANHVWHCSSVPLAVLSLSLSHFGNLSLRPNRNCCQETFGASGHLRASSSWEQMGLKFVLESYGQSIWQVSCGE